MYVHKRFKKTEFKITENHVIFAETLSFTTHYFVLMQSLTNSSRRLLYHKNKKARLKGIKKIFFALLINVTKRSHVSKIESRRSYGYILTTSKRSDCMKQKGIDWARIGKTIYLLIYN